MGTSMTQNNHHSNNNNNNSENQIRNQIQAEFQMLQSLIPDIANEADISELEIIDACVDYIERLQNQLSLHWSFPKIAARKSFLSNSTSTRSEIVKNETRHNI